MPALIRPMRNRRGVALLITLSVTTVLVTAALESNRRARYAVISSAATRNHLTMSEMASAGVQVAMAILAKDKADNDTDTPMDDWADPQKIEEVLREFPFEDGRLSLVISDETGKIQVNTLVSYPDGRQFNEAQRTLWERLLQYYADRKELKLDLKGDIERVGQEQAIEVRNIPANGRIKQVALMRPDSVRQRQFRLWHGLISIYGLEGPYMDIESHDWSD